MRLSHNQEYIILMCVVKTLHILPRRLALALGGGIGRLGWLLRIRKPTVIANLEIALPETNQEERIQIGAKAARSFGRTSVEFIRQAGSDRRRVLDFVEVRNIEVAKRALAEGKGAILITGHLASWALYLNALTDSGIPVSLLVGKQHNPKVDAFIHSLSGDTADLIPKGKSAIRDIQSKLKDGRCIIIVADQHAGPRGIFVPFMGKIASTLALPAAFVSKFQCPLLLMAGRRVDNENHTVDIERLTIPDPNASKEDITRIFNQALGERIARIPDQYFWYHRRWRESDLDDANQSQSS